MSLPARHAEWFEPGWDGFRTIIRGDDNHCGRNFRCPGPVLPVMPTKIATTSRAQVERVLALIGLYSPRSGLTRIRAGC